MPPSIASTPQRLGAGPILLGKQRRARAVTAQVRAGRAHTAALAELPRAVDALAAAQAQLPMPYGITSCRCQDRPCRARDCSGLIFYAINHVTPGPVELCGSSFSLARLVRDAGTIIGKEQALWTPGAVGIRCPFCAPNSIGSNGHVWWCEGDGSHSAECGGRRTGCYRGNADKPGDVIYALLPFWLDYEPAKLIARELDMFVQTHHYDAQGKPTRPTESPESVVFIDDDGLAIGCRNDASIFNDQPVDPQRPKLYRRWVSPAKPLPQGVEFTALAERPGDQQDPRPGGVALCSDGSTRRFRLS